MFNDKALMLWPWGGRTPKYPTRPVGQSQLPGRSLKQPDTEIA